MKTPKEYAEELVTKFENLETKQDEIVNDVLLGSLSVKFKREHCKKCALVTIREIKKIVLNAQNNKPKLRYLEETKKEIENYG